MNDFLWGGATASYQCEGGWQEGGRVESMWDVYLHENHLENGDVASDHYHRFREDIRMMKEGIIHISLRIPALPSGLRYPSKYTCSVGATSFSWGT